MLSSDHQALVARPDGRLTEALVQQYLSEGRWRQRRLDSYLWDAARDRPDQVALVGHDAVHDTRVELTYARYAQLVLELAKGLHAVGVRPGHTVSVMLPNTVEFAAAIFATFRAGAVYSGIPTAYGRREVAFMLRHTGSRVLVIPQHFRDRSFVAFVEGLLAEGTELDHVVVVDPAGALPSTPATRWLTLDELLAAGHDTRLPDSGPAASIAHVGFTSGTTGEPKGVLNSHQTLDVVLRSWIDHLGGGLIDAGTVNLIASPVGHHTGFLWGVLLCAHVQGTGVLLDRWQGGAGARIIRDEGVTLLVGAVAFLQDLLGLDAPRETWRSLRVVSIPGAPIPRGLVPRAREALGCFICPSWGMTEYGIGLSGAPSLPLHRVEATDGVPVSGCEVRVVDERDEVVPAGHEGNLQIRGAGLFLGYLDRPESTAEAMVDGWFRTGDRAIQERDGFTSLVGRTKDIIIRGGENIPVAEVETLLYEHPSIADAAIVGMPDDRLGERACACIVARTGHTAPTLDELTAFLLAQGLSRHFLPERVEPLDELPRTLSGKIRKVELRERVSATLGGGS